MQNPLAPRSQAELPVRRRQLLAGLAGAGAAASAGCTKRAHSMLNRSNPTQVSLTVKTVPADVDPVATQLARYLVKQLQKAGIDATVELMRRENLLLDVLFKQSFDCYIWRLPSMADPDALRSLLHSRFAVEAGWQNPFGYSAPTVDKLLDRQRRVTGSRRHDALFELQEQITQTLPFVTIAFPNQARAVRNDTVVHGWKERLHSPVGYCIVDAAETGAPDQTGTLRATIDDPRPTENLNPLATEYRDDWTITGLLYDSLVRRIGGETYPWLAQQVHWQQTETGDREVAVVHLREDCEWHDGEPVTAEDVAFTYRILQDTSLGRMESPLPAPAFRGRTSIVESVTPVDDEELRMSFAGSSRTVALRALTVPILPKHDWEGTGVQANVPGFQNGPVTRALVRENTTPVGSGPLRFDSRSVRNSLTLERNDDLFLHRADPAGLPTDVDGFDFEKLRFQVVPSKEVALELVLDADADVSATSLSPNAVKAVGEEPDVSLHVRESVSPYHLGFNVRTNPLSNVRFRQAVARLLDRSFVVDDLMGNFAQPSVSPLPWANLVPNSLEWSGEDPNFPFAGADGELNVEAAKQSFVDAGYRYSNGGKLLSR